MDERVKSVLARYREDPDQGSFRSTPQSEDWETYLKEKSEVQPINKGVVKSIVDSFLKDKDKDTKAEIVNEGFGEGYNPSDFEDPSSKPKDLEDRVPYSNPYPDNPGTMFIPKPDWYNGVGPMREWYKARHEDWTTPPEEQNPAISLDRKYEAADRVLCRHLLDIEPVEICLCEDHIKTAASLTEIRAQNTSPLATITEARARQCAVSWLNKNNKPEAEKGFYQFKVTSSGKTPHTVILQFLKNEDPSKPKGYLNFNVELACTCSSFLFYGAQYYAAQGKYMYMPGLRPTLRAPRPNTSITSISNLTGPKSGEPFQRHNVGKGLDFRLCKHLLAVVNFVSQWKTMTYYRTYPRIGRPSAIINKDVWKKNFGFDFSLENLRKELRKPSVKIPTFFKKTPAVTLKKIDDWFNTVWVSASNTQKVGMLRYLVEHPEEIYYVLLKESQYTKGKVHEPLIYSAFQQIDKVLKTESEEPPAGLKTDIPKSKEEKEVPEGTTGMVVPESTPETEPTAPTAPTAPTEVGSKIKPVTPAIGKRF